MRTASQYRAWLPSALMCLLFTANSYCQDATVNLKSPVCEIISLPYLLGEIALSLGEEKVIEKRMPCLLKLWAAQIPNDGTADIQLSNSFLFVMDENPQAFFSAMAAQPDAFSEWLSGLPKLSFTPVNSSACGLENKRKQLIYQLQKVRIVGTKEQAFRKSTLVRLSQTPNKGCG